MAQLATLGAYSPNRKAASCRQVGTLWVRVLAELLQSVEANSTLGNDSKRGMLGHEGAKLKHSPTDRFLRDSAEC